MTEVEEMDVVELVIQLEDFSYEQGRWPREENSQDIPNDLPSRPLHKNPPFWENAAHEADHR